MGKDTVVWITARDGSAHATQPPISAAGQSMLCGRSYSRLDLRIRLQGAVGQGPAGACPVCRRRIAVEAMALAGADPRPVERERRPEPALKLGPEPLPEPEGEPPWP